MINQIAPEFLSTLVCNLSNSQGYGLQVEMWACGIIAYSISQSTGQVNILIK